MLFVFILMIGDFLEVKCKNANKMEFCWTVSVVDVKQELIREEILQLYTRE